MLALALILMLIAAALAVVLSKRAEVFSNAGSESERRLSSPAREAKGGLLERRKDDDVGGES